MTLSIERVEQQTSADDCELSPELIIAAYGAIEAYDIETMEHGVEPHYPAWARKIVDRAQAQGMIWTNARAA